ncbi:MAG: glycosyltransferase [Nitrosopumilaceae archaeon]|nr:glycosyltransferase [Nitrosopumilaceae archaeon]
MNSLEKIKVTVYIPTYNRSNLLQRALASVQNQTYRNLDIIVIDDCSTDETAKIVTDISLEDKRVRLIQNESNSGACVSRNKAIVSAQGEFITGLDDDDFFLPQRIDNFLKTWFSEQKSGENFLALYSNALVQEPSRLRFGNQQVRLRRLSRPKRFEGKKLFRRNGIGNQLFAKTDLFRQVLFDAQLPMWQDWDCWHRLLGEFKAVNTKEYDYVLDVSHEHERITGKGSEVAKNAFNRMVDKYKLDNTGRARLYNSYYAYVVNPERTGVIFHVLVNQKSVYHSIRLLRLHISKILKKLLYHRHSAP